MGSTIKEIVYMRKIAVITGSRAGYEAVSG